MRVQPLLVNVNCHVVVVCDATTIFVVWLQRVTNTGQLDISLSTSSPNYSISIIIACEACRRMQAGSLDVFVTSPPQHPLCDQHTQHFKSVANQLDVRYVMRRIGFQPILCIALNSGCASDSQSYILSAPRTSLIV